MDENVSLARLAHRLEEVVGELRGIPVGVERLEDGELILQQIAHAMDTSDEVRAMYPAGTPEVGRRGRRNMPEFLDALRRGMRARLIVHTSMMDDPVSTARIREMHAGGTLYRITDEPVQQLLVFDRSVAFLRITPVAHAPGALLIRQQSLIAAFVDLFEKTWARSREATEPAYRLTPREREVLALIAEGRSNSAVARALSVTEAAVGKHVASVFAKLELPHTEDDNRRVLAVLTYLRGSVR
ncbi:hypothetical protein GCM10010156_38340 [Planobispora rosea]|uniref:HTH luxR-type domain-containing protein n=1 Tax=Planobispora rosea TaxID=35762 RepID=A0A8J3RYQ5_PLARO|nr:LuxR C-terminal-related transcriptional regulator [Planobispora rosea]GGS75841.1 hypothetical protein GCM10010156_38340 [Planobispora rosea]GIH81909.1 hypothetical protein Pro02_03170 [Planobispora rosea]